MPVTQKDRKLPLPQKLVGSIYIDRSLVPLVQNRPGMEAQRQARVMTSSKRSLSRFRRVCVFCGSSPGNKASYQVAAIQLGNELVITSLLIPFFFFFFFFLCVELVHKRPISISPSCFEQMLSSIWLKGWSWFFSKTEPSQKLKLALVILIKKCLCELLSCLLILFFFFFGFLLQMVSGGEEHRFGVWWWEYWSHGSCLTCRL